MEKGRKVTYGMGTGSIFNYFTGLQSSFFWELFVYFFDQRV